MRPQAAVAIAASALAGLITVFPPAVPRAAEAERLPPAARSAAGRLRVSGRHFVAADGSFFSWRGLTSFRLLEMVAHGRTGEARALLDWASARGVTVVRVLAMADVLFKLKPQEGRAALPRLLQLAAVRGLSVEIVALADTARTSVDVRDQVREVGAICGKADNCLLEIANEPWHDTQRRILESPETLAGLRALVPRAVPVTFGPATDDASDAHAGGDYQTPHLQRSDAHGGWGHVLRMRVAEQVSARTGKPVVDDEPIGAADHPVPGRRDADPARWRAKGLLARVLHLGTTFHYEGGLHSRLPTAGETACFDAWRAGLDALPVDLESRTAPVDAGSPGSALQSFVHGKALAAFEAQGRTDAWVVAVGVTGDPGMTWRSGWRAAERREFPGAWVVTVERRPGSTAPD